MARMRRISCVATAVAVLAVAMPAVRAWDDSAPAHAAQAQPAPQAFDLVIRNGASSTAPATVGAPMSAFAATALSPSATGG
jgi:hypothetical protein